jgi:hypothetical protein
MPRNVFLLIILLFSISGFGESKIILLQNGIDTLQIPGNKGFDFLLGRVCKEVVNGGVNDSCFSHIEFRSFNNYYKLNSNDGYALKMGKVNLDSIYNAPPDSVFLRNEIGVVDSFNSDSLIKSVGDVYILKTTVDPRKQYGLYVKFKILGFKMIDCANRGVEMRFLWNANLSGLHDIGSYLPIDTFRLDTSGTHCVSLSFRNIFKKPAMREKAIKFVGFKNAVIKESMGGNMRLGVFDIRGKKQGEILLSNNQIIGWRQFEKSNGVYLLRLEK